MNLFRGLLRKALAISFAASFASFEPLAARERNQVKIRSIKALQPRQGATLIKVETDAGLVGYGPCWESGPTARSVISSLETGRHENLTLIGKDPLAIQVHFQNLFYRVPQRERYTGVLSAIDIALWDLAGQILGLPVSKLLGGNFRDEIPLYSHCQGGDVISREAWRDCAQELLADPRGFRAFKVDIHHPLGISMQQFTPSIGTEEARRIHRSYTFAREAFGPDIDIIVHCHNELDVPSAIRVAEAVEPIKPLFYEDPLAPQFSESWLALRRATRLPLLTGENLELADQFLPFLQAQAVDYLQPDLINCGGITGAKMIADLASLYRIPICLHNVSGYVLNLASQQFSAAIFNCPMMECRLDADQAPEATGNLPVIRNGKMKVSTLPGLGVELDQDYLKKNRADGEPWWG